VKIVSRLFVLAAAIALAGCAESPQPAEDHPATISVPVTTANPDVPPPTLSGYVDTSYTSQGR
jgi:hypothetical protein